ncbi:MAG: hypothetical protein K0R17_3618 [Rariglobus sp.]|jgi:hypothetical protein|nr:hypothetical protein [Rariglobus sp.]
MNQSQIWKYRAEWAKAWKALRAAGTPAADQEKTRKRWHVLIGAVYLRGKEIGQPKSSTVLTNAEFDRFLKRCAATHTPDGLAEQLALDDQPLIRLQNATDPLLDLVKMPMEAREAYLAGIYKNVQRKRVREANLRELPLAEMPDCDLQLVVVALTHTVEHKLGVDHNHPRTGKGPKSRFAHEVGANGQNLASQTPASRTAAHVDPTLAVPEQTFDPSAPFG